MIYYVFCLYFENPSGSMIEFHPAMLLQPSELLSRIMC